MAMNDAQGSHIQFLNKVLTINPHYVKNYSGELHPVHLIAFELCYEYLVKFKANPKLFVQINEFTSRLRNKFSELQLIEEKDVRFRNSAIRLDNPDSINLVQFADQEYIVVDVYLTDLLFLARLFFRLDFVNQLISCQQNVLNLINFEVQSHHAQICKEIVRKSKQFGITRSRLHFDLICCLIKYKYQAKKGENFSHYCCPYPFSLDATFSGSDSGSKTDQSFIVDGENVRYVPPYSIWTEQDFCNGLVNQAFPAGVLFNQIEPQLTLGQLTFNELLDAAKNATEADEAQSQTTLTNINMDYQDVARTQYSRPRYLSDSRQIYMKQMLAKFRDLKQLCDQRKCEYTSYSGDYLFFTRPNTFSRLKPEDRRKISETLRGPKNIKFEEAQSSCSNFIKDYVNKKDARKLKKQKEKKKTQDKWLNDHVKDDWYLTARQHD